MDPNQREYFHTFRIQQDSLLNCRSLFQTAPQDSQMCTDRCEPGLAAVGKWCWTENLSGPSIDHACSPLQGNYWAFWPAIPSRWQTWSSSGGWIGMSFLFLFFLFTSNSQNSCPVSYSDQPSTSSWPPGPWLPFLDTLRHSFIPSRRNSISILQGLDFWHGCRLGRLDSSRGCNNVLLCLFT